MEVFEVVAVYILLSICAVLFFASLLVVLISIALDTIGLNGFIRDWFVEHVLKRDSDDL